MNAKVAKFIGTLDKVTSKKDGTGKITFDFGRYSLEEIQKIQLLNGEGEVCFAIMVVPHQGEDGVGDYHEPVIG